MTEQAGHIDHTGGRQGNRQYRMHRLASENRLRSMSETQAQSPKVCFLDDSYPVYKMRRDSPGALSASRHPEVAAKRPSKGDGPGASGLLRIAHFSGVFVMDEKRCGEYLRLVFRRGMRALLCKVAYAGRTNEPEHGRAVVQHGMTKLMSQSHSIPTDTHPRDHEHYVCT